MNCENPVFRNCDITTEGIYPTSKELILDKLNDRYIIQFKFNGKEIVECRPRDINITKIFTPVPGKKLGFDIYMGPTPQSTDPSVKTSKATIKIDRSFKEGEEDTDIEVFWYNYDPIPDDLYGPGNKISSCTIKFSDATRKYD